MTNKRPHLLSLLSLVLLLALAAACKKSEAERTYQDTPESFEQFAQHLIDVVKDDDRDGFDAIAKQVILPDAKAWFERTFGPEAGARLFAEYDASPMKDWTRGWSELRKMVVDQQRDVVTVSRHTSPEDDMATGHQANALRAMKQPVALYRIQLTRADGEKSFTLWSFVHEGGTFRFIGKTKQSKAPEPGSADRSIDSAVDMLGELPIRRARELMRERE